jgi:amino acid adenylation domain-containing protein
MESMTADAPAGRGEAAVRWRSVLAGFERRVAAHPEAQAVVPDGGTAWTYAQLDRCAADVATALERAGAGPDGAVGVSARRTPEMVAAVLGVMRAGAAYVPLDPDEPPSRLADMAARAGVRLVLDTGADEGDRFPVGPWTRHRVGIVARSGGYGPLPPRPAPVGPDDVAYVLYTSGSTGAPKGVMVTHGNLAAYVDWAVAHYRFAPGERALVHSPVTFDFTLTCLLAPLVSGGCVELLAADGPAALLATLGRRPRYGVLKLTPSHLELLGAGLPPEALRGLARTVVIGGEALHGAHLRAWRAADPATDFVNEYGPTEATVGCCTYDLPAGAAVPDGPVPIGRPIPGTRLVLLDDSGRPVPAGDVGEIHIAGTCVARGYVGAPPPGGGGFGETESGERTYRTGDLARVGDGGDLVYLGRRDSQVKVRGHRVELGEVEAALAAHAGVRAAAAAVRTRRRGDNHVVAFVVGDGGTPPAAEDLRRHVAGLLPEHMVPSQVVHLPELPLTRNGKVDRRVLPPASRERPVLSVAYEPPAQPREAALAGLWAEVLELDAVGVLDDFFDLGGDSLLAVELVARAESELGMELALEDLFDRPSVRGVLGGAAT